LCPGLTTFGSQKSSLPVPKGQSGTLKLGVGRSSQIEELKSGVEHKLMYPRRIMHELPSNMQQDLANLELEARSPQEHRTSTSSTVSSMQTPYLNQQSPTSQPPSGPGFTASYENTNASAYQNINSDPYGGFQRGQDSPKFSPFPKIQNPGPNVPLSDEDKEEVLEGARPLVLKSADPEAQLAWAQDALSWVEVASQNATRQQEGGQPARSITPKVEHQLRVDALSIVEFLAEQHHPKAEFMKGMWLEFGKFGYRIDKKEAFLAYRRAAGKGYARAEYRIGMQYETSNNSEQAIEHYQRGVAMKDSASNYRLGMMILLGQHGMQQDYQHGVDLIRFSADTADENAPQGAYVYGMLLARELPNITVPDHFLPYDLNDAKLFIEKAAYLGFAKAQLKMAQAYELCQLGCEFEPTLSLHYNALAARQGDAEADMAISKWFLCGYEGAFEKNEELAFTYAQRAAQAKMATAEFAMGYFYEIGMYVPVDLRESEMWYQKAAEHGNKDALGRIDSIKKNNTLSRKDHEQMAISRIKSQYGSQRGGRPDRFKQKPALMPAMSEEPISMPDPRNSYGGAGVGPLRPQTQSPLPQRPVSTAPYPDDDVSHMPGAYNSYSSQSLRPSSSGPQADRPSSAFGIRPLVPSNPGSMGQGMRPPQDGLRPSSSTGNMPLPAGRGSNPPGRTASSGWEPQILPKYREQPPIRPLSLPVIDMGRPTNFNQPNSGRLQKPLPPNMNKPSPPQPSQPNQGYDSSPYGQQPYSSAIPRRDPTANQFTRPERGSSITPVMSPPIMNPPQQRPDRYDSMQLQNPSRASQRPPQHTMSSQGQNARPASVAPSVASSQAGPPKKQGPSTFEEMGIPTAKNDSDCVSPTTLISNWPLTNNDLDNNVIFILAWWMVHAIGV
jgi:TPR repeat protein